MAFKGILGPLEPPKIFLVLIEIEGALRLLDGLGDGAFQATVRAPFLLRIHSIMNPQEGCEFRSLGDSYLVAYDSPNQAVESAANFLRDLAHSPIVAANPAGGTLSIQVRIGIHLTERGALHEPKKDGSASAIDWVTRLTALAAPAQLLVSDAAYQQAGVRANFKWRVWSNRRLGRLNHPCAIFELLWDDQSRGEPGQGWLPECWRDAKDRYIERPGRQDALLTSLSRSAAGRDHLRLVILQGPSGTGKTRLAIAAATQAAGAFRDGMHWIPLAPSPPSASMLAQAIGAVFGWHGPDASPPRLAARLRSKETLLILDNYDYADSPDTCAFLESLLSQSPDLSLLVLSRHATRLAHGRAPIQLEEGLTHHEAQELLVVRLQGGQSDAGPSRADLQLVNQIVPWTECLPMAIELLAARTDRYSLGDIAEGLAASVSPASPRLPHPETHRPSLARCLEWSLGRFDDRGRDAFTRLGIFRSSFTAAAAAAICELADAPSVLDQLAQAAFLRRADIGPEPRYVWPRSIQEFAAAEFAGHPSAAALRERFISYFRQVLEPHGRLDHPARCAALDADWRNFVEAMDMAEQISDSSALFFLIEYLAGYADERGYGAEILWFTRKAIAMARNAGNGAVEAMFLNSLGLLLEKQGEYREAEAACQRSIELFRHFGSLLGEGQALNLLSVICRSQQRWPQAEYYGQLSLGLSRDAGSRLDEGHALANLSLIRLRQGQWAEAEAFCQQDLAICWELNDVTGAMDCLDRLGLTCQKQERWTDAEAYLKQCLALVRERGDRARTGRILRSLGSIAERQSRWQPAEAYYRETLFICRALKDQRGLADTLHALAGLRARQKDWPAAIELEHEALPLYDAGEDAAARQQAEGRINQWIQA